MSILDKIREKLFTKSKLSNILFTIGLCVTAFGISQFSITLGIISAGVFLILIAWLLS